MVSSDLDPGSRSLIKPPDLIDYALKEYDVYDRAFDALDAKAGGIVQFVAIILGLSAFQMQVAHSLPALRITALGIFSIVLVLALAAWTVRSGLGVPPVHMIKARIEDKGLEVSENELLDALTESVDTCKAISQRKYAYLRLAFGGLLLGVVLLIVSLFIRT